MVRQGHPGDLTWVWVWDVRREVPWVDLEDQTVLVAHHVWEWVRIWDLECDRPIIIPCLVRCTWEVHQGQEDLRDRRVHQCIKETDLHNKVHRDSKIKVNGMVHQG